MSVKALFELIDFNIVFLNHVVYILDVVDKAILLLLYTAIPEHGKEPFDIRLSHCRILEHFDVGATLLPRQHICLAFHYSSLLSSENYTLLEASEDTLDGESSLFLRILFMMLVFSPCHIPFNG